MIDVPYEEAVERIHKETGLDKGEIEARIEDKLKQLSGLISRNGAVHILANELGVRLEAAAPQGGDTKIKDLKLTARGITVTGRVVRKYDVRSFDKNGRQGRVASLLLGDETGVTRLVFWNDQVDVFEELKEGDILVVKNPFVKQSYQKDRLELQLNQQSALGVNPEGVQVEQRSATDRAPRVQKYIKDLQGAEENVEIIATVVQVYDPRFYDSCPECRKKLTDGMCPQHGEVKPEMNFNMSAFLDDGTGNIRTSFWKQQALALTGKTEGEFAQYRDDPASFEELKTELLGEIIKVVGSVKKNDTFDRLEVNALRVFRDIDPAAEISSLEKKFEQQRTAPAKAPGPAQPAPAKAPVVEDDVISLDDLEEMDE